MVGISEPVPTLGATAYRRLREMILDGTLASGTRLQEKTFADRLGVSRTPVREAIGQLVSEGLVTRSDGGAPTVSRLSLTDLLEILHVRRLLECETARQAAQSNASTENLLEIRKIIAGFLSGPRPDTERHVALDDRLHVTLARMAGSRLLTNMISGLKTKTRTFDQGFIPERFEPGCQEHFAIIDAVVANDAAAAEDSMRLHLTNVRESIIGHIRRSF